MWEEAYLERLGRARAVELKHQRRFRQLQVTSTALGRASPMLAAALTFIIYSRFHALEADVIFPALSVFQSLRLPFILLPIIFNNLVSVFVSIRRLSTFLSLPEQPTRLLLAQAADAAPQAATDADAAFATTAAAATTSSAATAAAVADSSPPPPMLLQLEFASLGWYQAVTPGADSKPPAAATTPNTRSVRSAASVSSTAATSSSGATATPSGATATSSGGLPGGTSRAASVLDGVTLTVRGGELVALIGQVGCGKSTLLASAWGEAPAISGRVATSATVGVVPQRAFTISGTLRENLLMGRAPSEHLQETFREPSGGFSEASQNLRTGRARTEAALQPLLDACALEQDLKSLPCRLETGVGERGVTLSGGQQQRLALARALLSSPSLLLLDDPLSAVDARTCSALLATLDRYVHASGGTRAAVVSLNQPHLLRLGFDRCVSIDGEGRLHETSLRSEAIRSNQEQSKASGCLQFLRPPRPETPAGAEDESTAGGGTRLEAPPQDHLEIAPRSSRDRLEAPSLGADAIDDLLASAPAETGAAASEPEPTMEPTLPPTVMAKAADASTSIIEKETKKSGALGGALALKYYGAMGAWRVALYLFLLVSAYASVAAADALLAVWARAQDGAQGNATSAEREAENLRYMALYGGLSVLQALQLLACSLAWASASVEASRNLHGQVRPADAFGCFRRPFDSFRLLPTPSDSFPLLASFLSAVAARAGGPTPRACARLVVRRQPVGAHHVEADERPAAHRGPPVD